MSDAAEDVPQVEDAGAAAAAAEADPVNHVRDVLKNSIAVGGLARGLHEAAKAIDARDALLCFLASDCEEEAYKRLVEALCTAHSVPLIKVPAAKQLGEWAGLCKIDKEGKPRKVVACSCVVIKKAGEDSEAFRKLLEEAKSNA
eukprot:TRINITY_DN20529_c0_g1_i1.p2 TRINITY_DN20529_c0_g1~~TRINITY_DN20529_c0_g1_i1.p2  ORF type:complete len:144 (+),score=31.03 TRINITY_DN20529_c0_g1_i1:84-515(+)